jgi:partner of Y14 and mago protein
MYESCYPNVSFIFYSYENRGVQWLKSAPTLPPGLNPVDAEAAKKTDSQPMSKSAKKNAKRKEKKKQQQESMHVSASGENVDSISRNLAASKLSEDSKESVPSIDGDKATIEKKIRNLKKKLKQVDDLKNKIDSGEIKNPEKEQLAKVARRQELADEIEDLELDLED